MKTKAALAIKAVIWLMALRGIKWVILGFFRFMLAPLYLSGDEMTLGLSHATGCELRHTPEIRFFDRQRGEWLTARTPASIFAKTKIPRMASAIRGIRVSWFLLAQRRLFPDAFEEFLM